MRGNFDLFLKRTGNPRISLKFYENRDARRYFASGGGLITGILPPLSGGGTVPESCVGGGQITPFESESRSFSGLPDLSMPLWPGGAQDCEGGEAGVFVCASAAPFVSRRNETKNERRAAARLTNAP